MGAEELPESREVREKWRLAANAVNKGLNEKSGEVKDSKLDREPN